MLLIFENVTSKTYYICHTVMEMFAPGINVEGIQIGGPEAEPVSLPHLCVHPFPAGHLLLPG